MKRLAKKVVGVLLTAAMLYGCRGGEEACIEAPRIDTLPQVTITRLEDSLFAARNPRQVLAFLRQHPVITREFLGVAQYPSDTVLARELYRVISNPYSDSLLLDVKARFGDMQDLQQEFARAFAYIKHYYPDFRIPQIQTLVTGFGSSELFVSDSLIIIGLDYYLGPQGRYRPQGIPQYILKRFDKPYIVPAVVLLYADRFLRENPADKTMLADMIYYGKKYFFAKNMLPCTPDSLIIWYSGKELAEVQENRHIIWYHFLEKELLYETNHLVKQKYIGERPKVYEIGPNCPGRIGAWLGWDIVRTYRQRHPQETIQQILTKPDARQILQGAKYNPLGS
ncbi:MAG TPA: gliding motility lipoprotein GldB [Flammeovirgaceae bacterium]|nr:gliding motility lipoprotein GldB [Flammeovirgaceae bacterium]